MFAALLLAVPFVAQFVSAQSAGNCTRTYTVQPGDICDGISAAHNVSTWQLAVVNENIIDPECNNLTPGSTLCLGWAGEDCTDTYVVRADDTCDGITGAYNINGTIFSANNPQLDQACDNLYIGEVVCVCQSVQVPPPPASGTMPGSAIPPTATPASPDLPYCDEL